VSISFSSTRWLIAAAAVTALSAGSSSHPVRAQSPRFTPEVDEFVRLYLKTGGDKLTNWVQGQTAPPPDRTLRAFRPIEGLTMELVAAEPVIRQPIDLHFDDRGRLWVVQYQQYPFPAGLTINAYDQYLRARYTGVPAAPPNHVRGADKITVLEDKDGDGLFESHTDVITGLNITTSVLTGHGGIWVMNPPYLLFYRDKTADGLPDGDPEVRLAGFGLEDTHSLANSLTWGPDGWLYGVHGSTSTARVRGISFLGQAVWRYHPDKDAFELFAEGGGNPWTLSFDSKGRAYSGDNGGNSRGFHWVQGGRYEKNWPKHGPFTRPHSYGSITNMDHEGYAARFAMTSVVYEEGKLPGYEGQLISGMALTSRIQATRLVADGSTFRTVDTDALVTTADRSFRPVDTAVGPDGAIYVADWCDIRMDHTDPRDTWDKSCGRIWRLRAREYRPVAPFDLASRSTQQLVELLRDDRKWYREHARRLLAERGDRSLVPQLRRIARQERGQLALEALWTANLISGMDVDSHPTAQTTRGMDPDSHPTAQTTRGMDPGWALDLLNHPDAPIRSWALRLLKPTGSLRSMHERLIELARVEPDAEVRSELANTAARLDPDGAVAVLQELVGRQEDLSDKHIPLRIWWTLEQQLTRDADAVLNWLKTSAAWQAPLLTEHLDERIARRLAADRGDTPAFTRLDPDRNWKAYAQHPRTRMPGGKGDYTDWETNYTPQISDRSLTRLARLLEMAPANHRDRLLAGVKAGLEQGAAPEVVPERLSALVGRWWADHPHTGALLDVAARLGHPDAVKMARTVGGARPRTAGPAAGEPGRDPFLTYCAPCHQTDGSGMERLAAPLRNSTWVLGQEDLLIRIVLNGLKGELVMPPMSTLDDQQLAAILTYIRRAWGHEAGPVSPETVARVRATSEGRKTPWTRDELSTNPRR
jgi:putative membrane-bound dehydrogenase-like protein